MPRLGRADDLTPLTFAFTLAALVLAAFADLIDRRRQRLGCRFGQDRLARLRDHEGTDPATSRDDPRTVAAEELVEIVHAYLT